MCALYEHLLPFLHGANKTEKKCVLISEIFLSQLRLLQHHI